MAVNQYPPIITVHLTKLVVLPLINFTVLVKSSCAVSPKCCILYHSCITLHLAEFD